LRMGALQERARVARWECPGRLTPTCPPALIRNTEGAGSVVTALTASGIGARRRMSTGGRAFVAYR
jgi:hypothetical protein